MSEFRDRVALITGAAGALGEIVTRQFLDSGAHVVGVDIHWDEPPESERVLPVQLDLTDPAECRRAVNIALEHHRRIDMLFHLVGSYSSGAAIAETGDDVWHRMLALNLHSTFNLCREVLPHMLAARRGRIIAIGSKVGVDPVAGMGAYHVSKAAMHALIRVIAKECKATGVTANAILPGILDTRSNRQAMPEADRSQWVSPGVIAQLIMYLASEAAADINGALIPVYGKA
ncbi:MAG: SDR family oxidoreductase [Acidobacteria bacterium]|nr:SDR family oxidoreductase [Acidobacteriota bacterium]